MTNNDKDSSEIPLEERFEFGANWSKFIDSKFSSERIESSINVFVKFTGLRDLNDSTFLDVGCGSGLHSFAALKLGAEHVTSFDFDPNAVKTTLKLKEIAGNPANWNVFQGSILDDDFVASSRKYDFVYSWGVLHHTGNLWKALANTCSLVASQGTLYIAIYSLDVQPKSEYWLTVKKKYVNSGKIRRFLMEQQYIFRHVYNSNPILHLKGRLSKKDNRERGMDLLTDVRDWLGGWPMEFALDQDVISFVESKGFQLKNIDQGKACTEFLFGKTN